MFGMISNTSRICGASVSAPSSFVSAASATSEGKRSLIYSKQNTRSTWKNAFKFKYTLSKTIAGRNKVLVRREQSTSEQAGVHVCDCLLLWLTDMHLCHMHPKTNQMRICTPATYKNYSVVQVSGDSGARRDEFQWMWKETCVMRDCANEMDMWALDWMCMLPWLCKGVTWRWKVSSTSQAVAATGRSRDGDRP